MARPGEKLSIQSIEKMKASKIKKMQSKYNWELAVPYLDVELNISSRNRSKKFISLREFKNLVEKGMSIKEMNKITSRHLLQFYSNFAQGKITISEKDFKEEYNKGLSLDDIS